MQFLNETSFLLLILIAFGNTVHASSVVVQSPSAQPQAIDQGQTSIISIGMPSGGTAPYAYQWYVQGPGDSSYSAISNNVTGSDGTIGARTNTRALVFIADPSADQGTYNFIVKVTDSAAQATNSSAVSVTVTPYNSTWPNADNTGVPAGIVLVPSYFLGVNENEQVMDSMVLLVYDGYLSIPDTVSNLTLQRVYVKPINCNDSTLLCSNYPLLGTQSIAHLTLKNSELNGSTTGLVDDFPAEALEGGTSSLLIEGSNIHGVITPFFTTNNSAFINNYIWNVSYSPAYGGGHNENIFVQTSSNVQIRHNTLLNKQQQTAAIFLDSYNGNINNVTEDDNLVGGGDYCIYATADNDAYPVTNETITNNHFATNFFPQCAYYGPVTGLDGAIIWQNNVWNNNNTLIT